MTKSQTIYANAADTSSHWPVFAQPWWWQALDGNWQVFQFTHTVNEQYFFVYILEKKGKFTLIRLPHLTPYMGFLCTLENPSASGKVAAEKALQSFLQQFTITEFDWHFDAKKYFPFLANKKTHTNVLHLQMKVPFEKKYSNSTKRAVQFGLENYTVSNTITAKQVFTFLQNMYAYKNLTLPCTQQVFEHIVAAIKNNQAGELLCAIDAQQNIVAAVLLVIDKNVAYALLQINTTPTPSKGSMAYLLNYCIDISIEKKCTYFDFEGSKTPGVDNFYKSFGAQETVVHSVSISKNYLAKTLLFLKRKWLKN